MFAAQACETWGDCPRLRGLSPGKGTALVKSVLRADTLKKGLGQTTVVPQVVPPIAASDLRRFRPRLN
jgi:hypothetical protein